MFVRDMRCCSVVTVIVDCFMVCLHVVICSSGFYHIKAASEADTAEEEEENRVLASVLGDNDGGVAAEEMETGTEAALPTPASSEASGEVSETVTEATVPAPASAAAT